MSKRIGLETLSLLATQFYSPEHVGFFPSIRSRSWKKEGNLKYQPLTEERIDAALGAERIHLFEDVLPYVSIEAIVLPAWGEIKPHFHRKSGGVILCITDYGNGYFKINGNGTWISLGVGQVVVIPKRTVHGFQAKESPLLLLGITQPGIADDDVMYV